MSHLPSGRKQLHRKYLWLYKPHPLIAEIGSFGTGKCRSDGLLGKVVPDDRCIADFRKENAEAIKLHTVEIDMEY